MLTLTEQNRIRKLAGMPLLTEMSTQSHPASYMNHGANIPFEDGKDGIVFLDDNNLLYGLVGDGVNNFEGIKRIFRDFSKGQSFDSGSDMMVEFLRDIPDHEKWYNGKVHEVTNLAEYLDLDDDDSVYEPVDRKKYPRTKLSPKLTEMADPRSSAAALFMDENDEVAIDQDPDQMRDHISQIGRRNLVRGWRKSIEQFRQQISRAGQRDPDSVQRNTEVLNRFIRYNRSKYANNQVFFHTDEFAVLYCGSID